jgi:hypothetical protein
MPGNNYFIAFIVKIRVISNELSCKLVRNELVTSYPGEVVVIVWRKGKPRYVAGLTNHSNASKQFLLKVVVTGPDNMCYILFVAAAWFIAGYGPCYHLLDAANSL